MNYSYEALIGKGGLTLTEGNIVLQPKVYKAFIAMAEAAAEEGIVIEIVSGYRSFERQEQIWNRKFREYTEEGLTGPEAVSKIVEYSTIPGTSRHHWGTEIDIIDSSTDLPENVLSESHFREGGPFFRLKRWMDEHSERFGFYLVYPDSPGRKGFHFEPWHYSFGEISKPMLKSFVTIDIANLVTTLELEGIEHLTPAFLEAYTRNHILDIHPGLR